MTTDTKNIGLRANTINAHPAHILENLHLHSTMNKVCYVWASINFSSKPHASFRRIHVGSGVKGP